MIYLACALLALGLFLFVFAPVTRVAHSRTKTRLEHLRERKDALYDNLRDLNFEFRAGKFPEADYHAMRAGLEDEAARILVEITALEGSTTSRPASAAPGPGPSTFQE